MAASRIPPLLEPYLAAGTKESSIVLITGVVGASTNWLTLRVLCHHLYKVPRFRAPQVPPAQHAGTSAGHSEGGDTGVLLVSFLRKWDFWQEGLLRLGLDVKSLTGSGRLAFVDGLTQLTWAGAPREPDAKDDLSRWFMNSPDLGDAFGIIRAAIEYLRGRKDNAKVVVMLDGLDFLLAASIDGCTAEHVHDHIYGIRGTVDALYVTLSADEPMLEPQETDLEKETAALITSMAYEASTIMSLRKLETGGAKEVTGVLRIHGGGAAHSPTEGDRELLYRVRDWNASVFERGQ